MSARLNAGRILVALLVGTAWLGLPSPGVAVDYDHNKDLRNLGPDAQDIVVVLRGSETVTKTFDGYTWPDPKYGYFSSVSYGPSIPNTKIHWRDFWDGTDATINTDQVIHVGWITQDHESQVFDMYWTDASGEKIPGSVVYNITAGRTYYPEQGTFICGWVNVFHDQATITVSNVHYAILQTRLPLDSLNAANAGLAAALQPLPGGSSFDCYPGVPVTRLLPGSHPEGTTVVVRYDVTGPGSAAAVTDYVQFEATTAPIPTLTEWGMIIMFVVMAAGIVWFVVRQRRRMATA